MVVDTSGMVSGICGQLVKYYKVDLLEPDLVVGLQRGEELDPILGVIERFFGVDAVSLPIHPGVVPTSVEQRAEQRERAMASYFQGDLQRFRVKPTVFMPTLPDCSICASSTGSWWGCPTAREGSPGSATWSSWPRTAGCA